jgi:hypothetical protein
MTGARSTPLTKGSDAHVAQSAERVLGKDEVISSILIVGSTPGVAKERVAGSKGRNREEGNELRAKSWLSSQDESWPFGQDKRDSLPLRSRGV